MTPPRQRLEAIVWYGPKYPRDDGAGRRICKLFLGMTSKGRVWSRGYFCMSVGKFSENLTKFVLGCFHWTYGQANSIKEYETNPRPELFVFQPDLIKLV